jgi:RNA polymerase sigma factor (sigma-70 family)
MNESQTGLPVTATPEPGAPAHVQDESDTDLLLLMSMRREDPAAARGAWEEFYLRHGRYLKAVCLRAFGSLLRGEVDDLVAETFRRAYKHSESFQDGGVTDPDRLRRRTRAWLGRIAQRLMQDQLRGRSLLPTALLDQDHWQNISGRKVPASETKDVARVREALARLSHREQMVLRTTMQWYQPDKQNQRMPAEAIEELAGTLETTPENLRQIRSRALRKLKEILTREPSAPVAARNKSSVDYDWKTLFPTRRKRRAPRRPGR